MPRFDFRCKSCGSIRSDVWVSNFRDSTDTFVATAIAPCGNCGGPLEKIPAAPAFTVHGFNAKNHYGAKS